MSPSLPFELYHHLASHITSSATLASFCLTSKSLHRILTPHLYTSIHIQDIVPYYRARFLPDEDILVTISQLPVETHLRHVRSLYIGRGVYRGDASAFHQCIEKMPNLLSLTIANGLGNWQLCAEDHDPSDLEDSADLEALALLASRGILQKLRLRTLGEGFEFILPLFRNLRVLLLDGMQYDFAEESFSAIVSVLVACPELEHLGLTELLFSEESNENHGRLWQLCSDFHSRRTANPSIPRLKLKKLTLGTAYRPESRGTQYLDQLTDLSVLEELEVENGVEYEWYNDRQEWEDFSVFASCGPALWRLKLSRLTQRALNFIFHLRASNPGVLTEIAGFEDDNNEQGGEDNAILEDDPLFALPFDRLGGGWRNVSLRAGLGSFTANCEGVEKLSCFLPTAELQLFKTNILPNLTKLHTLMIPSAEGVFSEYEDRMAKGFYLKIPEEELSLQAAQDEVVRGELAEELFNISHQAWEKRGCEGQKLKWVGLGSAVYKFESPGLGGIGEEIITKAIRVSKDEARRFEEVRMVEEWTFEGTEYF